MSSEEVLYITWQERRKVFPYSWFLVFVEKKKKNLQKYLLKCNVNIWWNRNRKTNLHAIRLEETGTFLNYKENEHISTAAAASVY